MKKQHPTLVINDTLAFRVAALSLQPQALEIEGQLAVMFYGEEDHALFSDHIQHKVIVYDELPQVITPA